MSSPALEALVAELAEAKRLIEPEIEGLEDFARLNVKPDTAKKLQETLVEYKRRHGSLANALATLDSLSKDGYPGNLDREVMKSVHDDLAGNVATIQAAFARFTVIAEATNATIVPGNPEPK